MAIVNQFGIKAIGLEGFKKELESAFTDALGSELNLSTESPQGQIIASLALILTQSEQALISVANGLNWTKAIGYQLDDLASILGIKRLPATKSTIKVTLSGTAGTVLPDSTSDTPARFATADGETFVQLNNEGGQVVIGSDGTINDVNLVAENTGPIAVAIGKLNTIVDAKAGLNSVNNPAIAESGTNEETDFDFRNRYARIITRTGLGTVESIIANLISNANCKFARIISNGSTSNKDNSTDNKIPSGTTIKPNTIWVITDGGNDNDIAQIINDVKGFCATVGAKSQIVEGETVYWTDSTNVIPYIRLTINLNNDAEVNLLQLLSDKIVDYFNNQLIVGQDFNEVDFYIHLGDLSGFTIVDNGNFDFANSTYSQGSGLAATFRFAQISGTTLNIMPTLKYNQKWRITNPNTSVNIIVK